MPTEVVGAVALKKALNKYAPDLAKELTKELGAILKPVVNEARSYVPIASPMSGWSETQNPRGKFPKYNALEIRKGILYKTTPSKPNRAGFVNNIRIQNKSMIGAIYETAGRKNGQGQDWVGPRAGGASKGKSRSNNPYAGNQFISNLGQLYGPVRKGDHRMMGRLIFRAWAKTQGKANASVFKAIENTTTKFNKRTAIVDVRRAA
tara:strand:+ start:108 stop:725 length:618 start_codon:yes stop_codon:yes gene_type:complete